MQWYKWYKFYMFKINDSSKYNIVKSNRKIDPVLDNNKKSIPEINAVYLLSKISSK